MENTKAFISYKPLSNSYVSLANNTKILIYGCGTIQIKINGYILRLHNVYHVPNLNYNFYSVKEHKHYHLCECSFGHKGNFLTFPKFSFHVNNQEDLMVYVIDIDPSTNKIHWCSTDGTHILSAKTYHINSTPRRLPSYKSNPSKNHYRRLTTINLHKYFGFHTLTNHQHFQQVA